eukprot:scaffold1064_cov142-Ochromonas_danica.AAC.2
MADSKVGQTVDQRSVGPKVCWMADSMVGSMAYWRVGPKVYRMADSMVDQMAYWRVGLMAGQMVVQKAGH